LEHNTKREKRIASLKKKEVLDLKKQKETRRVCYKTEIDSHRDLFPTKTTDMKAEKVVGTCQQSTYQSSDVVCVKL
jgi:hypothetical protein